MVWMWGQQHHLGSHWFLQIMDMEKMMGLAVGFNGLDLLHCFNGLDGMSLCSYLSFNGLY